MCVVLNHPPFAVATALGAQSVSFAQLPILAIDALWCMTLSMPRNLLKLLVTGCPSGASSHVYSLRVQHVTARVFE
eukprot:38377-Eustigmatos_ZCMA.PRE.1